jgi:cytochrome o ubiquinol oxidase operon protein cyoD
MKTAHHSTAPTATHGNAMSYTTGLVLSLALTLTSFGVIMSSAVPHRLRLAAIVVLCVAQLLVQLVYFLHMGSHPDQRANSAIFACTGLLIAIVVAGSLWVMHNANVNMMPTQMSTQHAMSVG